MGWRQTGVVDHTKFELDGANCGLLTATARTMLWITKKLKLTMTSVRELLTSETSAVMSSMLVRATKMTLTR